MTFDLSAEKADQLENNDTFQEIKRREYKNRLKGMTYFVVFTAVMWLGVLALNVFLPFYDLVSYGGAMIVFGALIVLTAICISYVFSVMKSKSAPVPLAGLTPEETVKNFFEAPLNRVAYQLSASSSWLKTYVCLLDQVKRKEGSFDVFVEHMKKWSLEINKRLKQKLPAPSITKLKWQIISVKAVETNRGVALYETQIKIDLWQGMNNPGHTSQTYTGSANLVLIVPMAQIGSRHYLASLPINEQIV